MSEKTIDLADLDPRDPAFVATIRDFAIGARAQLAEGSPGAVRLFASLALARADHVRGIEEVAATFPISMLMLYAQVPEERAELFLDAVHAVAEASHRIALALGRKPTFPRSVAVATGKRS